MGALAPPPPPTGTRGPFFIYQRFNTSEVVVLFYSNLLIVQQN